MITRRVNKDLTFLLQILVYINWQQGIKTERKRKHTLSKWDKKESKLFLNVLIRPIQHMFLGFKL